MKSTHIGHCSPTQKGPRRTKWMGKIVKGSPTRAGEESASTHKIAATPSRANIHVESLQNKDAGAVVSCMYAVLFLQTATPSGFVCNGLPLLEVAVGLRAVVACALRLAGLWGHVRCV